MTGASIEDEITPTIMVDDTTSSSAMRTLETNNDSTLSLVVKEALRKIGYDAYPIDPVSEKALYQIFEASTTNDDDNGTTTTELYIEKENDNSHPDSKVTVNVTEIFTKYHIGSTDNATAETPEPETDDNKASTSTPDVKNNNNNDDDDNLNFFQEMILRQMEQQTKLLLLLHERMEIMSGKIDKTIIQQQQPKIPQTQAAPSQWINQHQFYEQQRDFLDNVRNNLPQQQQQQPGIRHRVNITYVPPPPIPMIPPHLRNNNNNNQPGVQPVVPRQTMIQAVLNFRVKVVERLQNTITTVQSSKFVRTLRLFIALYSRHVRRIDFGVAIKLLFMISIVLSRIHRNKQGNESEDGEGGGLQYSTKFILLSTLVFFGLLYQNGFFKFLYIFFIKENYIQRILDGEEIDINTVRNDEQQPADARNNNNPADGANAAANNNNAAAGGQQQPPIAGQRDNGAAGQRGGGGANDAAGAGGFNWRRTLLGGGIAPPAPARIPVPRNNDPQQDNAVVILIQSIGIMTFRILQDIVFLFGSFFLSILPMWRPIPLDPVEEDDEEEEGAHDDDEEEEEDEGHDGEDDDDEEEDDDDDGEDDTEH